MAPQLKKKHAHCLLVSANRTTRPYPVFPLGLAHLIDAVQKQGHFVDHIDVLASNGTHSLVRLLQEKKYDVIGISIRNIDSVDSSSPELLLNDIAEIIELIRKISPSPIVLGGPGFSIMPEELLEYLNGDFGVVGEGELAFPELINCILEKKPITQRLFSRELIHYPQCTPHYTKEITDFYISHGGMLNIQTKRGCGYGCTYCSYPSIEGRIPRYRDPVEIAEEVRRITTDNEARYIFFTDSVFNDHTDHHLQIAEALLQSENTIPWCAFFRPHNIKIEDLRLMKRSGLAALELGTDCATDETLGAINKGFTFENVVTINERIVSESLPCAHFVMFGGPSETVQTFHRGLHNLDRLRRSIVFAYVGLRILPGTELYKRALSEKFIHTDTNLIHPVFYFSPGVDQHYLDQTIKENFKNKHDRIYPMKEMEEYIRLFHSLGHSGPLWDLLLRKRL